MKKLIIILAAICLFFSSAAAEKKFSLQAYISAVPDPALISLDLYDMGDGFYAETSLLPDKALFFGCSDESVTEDFSFLYLPAGLFRTALTDTETTIIEWISRRSNAEVYTGFYTGDLFRQATNKISTSFTAAELADFLHLQATDLTAKNGVGESPANISRLIMSYLGIWLQSIPDWQDMIVHADLYDQAKYVSISFIRDEQAVICVSADLSSGNSRKIVTVTRTQNSYYFTGINIQCNDDRIDFRTSVYSSASQSYRNATSGIPFITIDLNVVSAENNKNDLTLSFIPANTAHPLLVKGSIEQDNIHLKASVEENTEFSLELFAKAEETNHIDFSGKELIDLTDAGKSEDVAFEIMANFWPVLSQILQAVPSDYQEILTKLITF